jgi:Papain family cysteine protease
MPIRMVKDEDDNSSDNSFGPPTNGGGGGNSGGGGGKNPLLSFLPLILGFLFKNPKMLLVALVIGAIFYFKGGCSEIMQATAEDSLSTGCSMNNEEYDKAEVFAALSDDPTKNALPDMVSLLRFAPQRLNQGQQGSCVAWSSAYGARTILESSRTGQNPDDIAFSPSFLYNQISLEGCQGSYIIKAMQLMSQQGALPLKEFGYTDADCDNRPDAKQKIDAAAFKMRGYNRLSMDGDDYAVDFMAIKQNLSQGAPVVIGMMVGGTFMQEMQGQKLWRPTQEDYQKFGFGGHAMCVIGYDDKLEGGAFQIMNSWGKEWGEDGIGWVKYKDFMYFVVEAYGLDPMAKVGAAANAKFSCTFGLVDNKTKNYISLKQKQENVFVTNTPIKKLDKFKIEVKNQIECYTYVFGQETDGSSYVLFPYTPKHSAFCGITGTRIFPRDYSLEADNIGNKDFMAIVVTKQPLDYKQLNAAINASKLTTYQEKINKALEGTLLKNVKYTAANNQIGFEAAAEANNAVVAVLEIDKR